MDVLTDLFREAGLRRRLLDVRQLPADRALRFPCDRSVGFHVALTGGVFVHPTAHPTEHPAGGAAPIALQAGDVAVMARGCVHLLSPCADLRGVPVHDLGLTPAGRSHASPDGERAVVSGAYQLWNTPVHPFFTELPPFFVLRAGQSSQLDPVRLTVAMLAEEARREALGRDTVLHGLLDVLFTQLLRIIVEQRDAEGAGAWCRAVRDPHIRQAVGCLHEEFARDWTLEALARAVGLSRSVLAERFREVMGDTPLSYLRTVRMQRAMRLLTESTQSLEQVALAVGYQDAFGFSKAFKKTVGESPGEFRRRDLAEQRLPWRLPASDAVSAG